MQLIYSGSPIDLLVLDPDLPCLDGFELARNIAGRIPQVPVVLHGVRGSDDASMYDGARTIFIEKNGCSVEMLKETIRRVL